jgi:hypothetical protein
LGAKPLVLVSERRQGRGDLGSWRRVDRVYSNEDARAQFDRAHRLSVIVNAAQLLAVAWSFARLA